MGRLVESILLHDRIVVPTQDMMSLALLLGGFGEDSVIALLQSGHLRFARYKGALCYVGNGTGLAHYMVQTEDGREVIRLGTPLDETIDWLIDALPVKPSDRRRLLQLVIDATDEVDAPPNDEAIQSETYGDILDSTDLRNRFALRNTDMNHLVGVAPNEVRIYPGPDYGENEGDEIDTILRLAMTNIELLLAARLGCEDLSTSNPVGHVLKAKVQRAGESAEGFATLREIAGIPDLGAAVLDHDVSVDRVLRLRHSRHAGQFRSWFHENCRTDPTRTAREYVGLLRSESWLQSGTARTIRFIVTNAIGLTSAIDPIAGTLAGLAAGAIDQFALDKLRIGRSPKFFIESLRQLE
jgi:hypothetical protein